MALRDDWQRDAERVLAHFARSGKRPAAVFAQLGHPTHVWTPAADIYETTDRLVVLLELAGVDPSQTEVHAEPGLLRVRGVRRERHGSSREGADQRTYHALEIPYGRFERLLHLPPGLDTSAAQATYRDGLLEISLPRRAPTQVRINVQRPESSTDEATE